MTFQDTYQTEVLKSRRTRSQRALFWAKVVGFVLMVTIAATLRSDPQLRMAIMGAGMDGVLMFADKPADRIESPSLQMPDLAQMQALLVQAELLQGTLQSDTSAANPSRDAVPVNRFGINQRSTAHFQLVTQTTPTEASYNEDLVTKAVATELSQLLQAMKPGH